MKVSERKSIRKYQSREVSEELINELLEVAMHTPTMGNMQLYSVVETRSEEMKAKLLPLHFGQPMITGAPVVLTFCADFNRFTRWCEERHADASYDNALSFLNAASDTLLFTQNFCTLAEEKGLGTCYLGTTLYNPQGIIDVLGLPKLTFPLATITVGWPDEDPAQSDRLPLKAILHKEHYTDYSSDAIETLYALKESLPENQEFVRVNGKENLAQVFTDCRYTRKDNESLSQGLVEVLKGQGFL